MDEDCSTLDTTCVWSTLGGLLHSFFPYSFIHSSIISGLSLRTISKNFYRKFSKSSANKLKYWNLRSNFWSFIYFFLKEKERETSSIHPISAAVAGTIVHLCDWSHSTYVWRLMMFMNSSIFWLRGTLVLYSLQIWFGPSHCI